MNKATSGADDSPTFFFSPITIHSFSLHTIYHCIPSSLISMHKLCSLPPSSPCKPSFFLPFFPFPCSLYSCVCQPFGTHHQNTSGCCHWLSLAALLGLCVCRDMQIGVFLFFFCKAVFEQAGRWVNLIKERCGPEEEKKVAGMSLSHALMPVCVQTSTEDASRSCRRTVLIYSTGKHGTHQEAELHQLWRLHSQHTESGAAGRKNQVRSYW